MRSVKFWLLRPHSSLKFLKDLLDDNNVYTFKHLADLGANVPPKQASKYLSVYISVTNICMCVNLYR